MAKPGAVTDTAEVERASSSRWLLGLAVLLSGVVVAWVMTGPSSESGRAEPPETTEPAPNPTAWEDRFEGIALPVVTGRGVDESLALDAPPGSRLAVKIRGGKTLAWDLHDGSFVEFAKAQVWAVTADYILGASSARIPEGQDTPMFVYEIETGRFASTAVRHRVRQAVQGEEDGEIWLVEGSEFFDRSRVRLIDAATGQDRADPFEVSEIPLLVRRDGRAPLLSVPAGGVYELGSDGPASLGRGWVVAAFDDTVVNYSCDKRMDCSVVAAAGGTETAVSGLSDQDEWSFRYQSAFGPWLLSPDGYGGAPSVLDLRTQERIDLGSTEYGYSEVSLVAHYAVMVIEPRGDLEFTDLLSGKREVVELAKPVSGLDYGEPVVAGPWVGDE